MFRQWLIDKLHNTVILTLALALTLPLSNLGNPLAAPLALLDRLHRRRVHVRDHRLRDERSVWKGGGIKDKRLKIKDQPKTCYN